MEKLLTIQDVAEKLNVNTNTVYKWKAAGKITCIKLPGGDIRFKPEWLENWLNMKTVKAKLK